MSGNGSGAPGIAPLAGMNGALSFGRRGGPFGRPASGIGKSLAVGVQPNHLGAERDRIGEQCGVGGQGNVQTWPNEIGLEAQGKCRVRHDRGEIRHHVLGSDFSSQNFRKVREQGRLNVWLRRRAVTPQWVNATSPTMVVMQIGN